MSLSFRWVKLVRLFLDDLRKKAGRILTINVPGYRTADLKMREIILFLMANYLWGISRDILRGPSPFWPLNYPERSGTLVILCAIATTILNLLHLHIKLSRYVYTAELAQTLSFDCWQISIFADFSGSAGHKVGGNHFMYRTREKCGRLGNWAWIFKYRYVI